MNGNSAVSGCSKSNKKQTVPLRPMQEGKLYFFRNSLKIPTYPQINCKVDQAHVLHLKNGLHLKILQTS